MINMAKSLVVYICQNCDAQFQKWLGRCLECGQWGTIQEQIKSTEKTAKNTVAAGIPAQLFSIEKIDASQVQRLITGIGELDRVLGGGLVPGSIILLGGEPGIGKSTLALQLAYSIDHCLYISGEESVGQIKLRFDRLDLKKNPNSKLMLANDTDVSEIIAAIEQQKPRLAVIDSIQTIHSKEIASEAGSPAQIRSCAVQLLEVAKRSGTSICIIGHVTKDGFVAGPKTLEHLVDTVLYLEGERSHTYRILRSVKNRFGETNEVGVF